MTIGGLDIVSIIVIINLINNWIRNIPQNLIELREFLLDDSCADICIITIG
jgi:hypothetical protein